MRKKLRSLVLWLGSALIFVLAVPAAALLAMIYGISSLVDRAVGRDPEPGDPALSTDAAA